MTTPSGHSNEINLAALWVPVMPETSHMGESMREAGRKAKQEFESGFNSGVTPESMGQTFGSKLTSSISSEFRHLELPLGMSGFFEKVGGDIDKNLVAKLRGEASSALQTYRGEYEKLTDATQRQATAETEVNNRRAAGLGAHSIIPYMREEAQARQQINEQLPKTAAAYDLYNEKTTKLNAVTSEAADSGKLLAGIMGGLMVVAAQQLVGAIESVVEHVIEGAVEAFKTGIEVSKEFAEHMIELGETYELIGIQIHEFSGAAGHDFEEMEHAAQQVFSGLDVAGKDVGKTMAQLSSMLGAPGEEIKDLVGHVVELQGRFTNLRAADLGAAFVAFKTPAHEADEVLASLQRSAQNAGIGLGDLTGTLTGVAAATLKEAGLNIQQAGAFIAEMTQHGIPARTAMMGLSSAMKEFAKPEYGGMGFADGLKLAAERLNELQTDAEKQTLAEQLFGTRQWTQVLPMIEEYFDIVQKGPEAFNASAEGLNVFLEQTQTLENKWEEVKHKIEDAFKPMGMAALEIVIHGLETLGHYVDTNIGRIKHSIINFGLTLISFAAEVQKLGEGMLDFFGPIVNAIASTMSIAVSSIGVFSHAVGEVLSHIPGFRDMGNGMITAGKAAEGFGIGLDRINLGDKMHKLAEFSKQHRIDVQKAGEEWINFAENVDTAMGNAHNSIESHQPAIGGIGGWISPPTPESWGGHGGPGGGVMPMPPGIQGVPGASSGPDISGVPGALTPGSFGPHGGNSFGGGNVRDQNRQLAQAMFPWPASEWGAFDALENSEAGYDSTAKNPHSTAYGMGQFLDSTWQKYGYPAQGSQNPQTQLQLMFQYIAERYGTPSAAWAFHQSHNWYSAGGPSGNDTIPAWLSPGEYVWDTKTVDKFGWLIQLLHQGKGFDTGGPVDDVAGVSQQILMIDQIAKGFHLSLTAGKSGHGTHDIDQGFHDTGEAGDFSNSSGNSDEQLAFAMYLFQHFGSELAELIYSDPRMPKLIKDGKVVDPGFYGADTLAGHKNHVHVAVRATQALGDLSPGSDPLSGGMPWLGGPGAPGSTPGGKNGLGFPGLPGQYGGYGVYGGETYDQQRQAAKAVQEAKDRKADLDYQVQQRQRDIDKIQADIADLDKQPKSAIEILTGTDPKKVQQKQNLEDRLIDAKHQLEVATREAAEQTGNISDAERKQQESMYKKPSGMDSVKEYKVPGVSEFTQLGGGLVKGFAQELGFGDIFAKAPWEWGIVKLFAGLANWGLGTANAWANEIGKGHTGMTNFQPIEGWEQSGSAGLQGVLGGFGINLPMPKPQMVNQFGRPISGGPNVVAQQSIAGGQGGGPAPGPMVAGDYMPINVFGNQWSDPSQMMRPIQEQQNASSFTASGGFPAS